MIGKVRVHSTGYDPNGPPVHDLTLEPSGTIPGREGKPLTLTPIGRRILVVPVSETYGGSALHIKAEQLAKELRLCCVLSVGPKAAKELPQLAPGSPVYVKPYFGVELVVNGQNVLLIKPEDVQGVARFKG